MQLDFFARSATGGALAISPEQRRVQVTRKILTLIYVLALVHLPVHAQDAGNHPGWPGAGQLFVGTCYQPVDRSPEQVHADIALMKRAGFKVVRMGDLAWDYFEPQEGRFTFERFD